MTIEVGLLLTIAGLIVAIIGLVFTSRRDNRQMVREASEEIEERATMNAKVMAKLDSISEDLKEIKKDSSDLRHEVTELSKRVLICEQKLQFNVNYPSGYSERVKISFTYSTRVCGRLYLYSIY